MCVGLCAGAPLPWRDRIKLMGKSETRRQNKFDTERVWTFTIYQNLVREADPRMA